MEEFRVPTSNDVNFDRMLSRALVGVEDDATADVHRKFKADLIEQYSKEQTVESIQHIFCMLTGSYLPGRTVSAMHIWKCEWARSSHFVGFEDVHDTRNGLLLFKPIEWAFQTSRLILVYDPSDQEYRAHILDGSILNNKLLDKMEQLDEERGPFNKNFINNKEWESLKSSVGSLTFGDLHGRKLVSDRLPLIPFRHILKYHSQRCMIAALDYKWRFEMPSTADFGGRDGLQNSLKILSDLFSLWTKSRTPREKQQQQQQQQVPKLLQIFLETPPPNFEGEATVTAATAGAAAKSRPESARAPPPPAPPAPPAAAAAAAAQARPATAAQQSTRPPGMSKSAYKNWKRRHNRRQSDQGQLATADSA